MPLRVPSHRDPVVSLVMVVYGRYELARRTLATLAETVDVETEVIIVDNDSPDGAGRRLEEEVTGVRFLPQPRNLGFGVAADLGVMHARGPYVGILNSDLAFASAWLSPLVRTLEEDPRCGAAVPLYVDGSERVLGAGGLVGGDGEGYLYGLGRRVDDPGVRLARRVDYGPAACLLARRAAFDRVGGFDPAYGIGYFEDTDFGFALREAGFHTRYVPSSVVEHVHGGTFGRELHARQVAVNRPRFVEQYTHALRGRPRISRPPFDPHRELVLRDWWAEDRVLLLDSDVVLAPLAAAVAIARPDALVTWVSAAPPPAPAHDGVEWIAGERRVDRWLEERRFHYSAVLTAGSPPHLEAVLDRSQPQARRGRWGASVRWPDVSVQPGAGVEAVLESLGVPKR